MSVYSGFCTRKQETEYNECLSKILQILAQGCLRALKQEILDVDKFNAYFKKYFQPMVRLENRKYLPPKFSDDLQCLGIFRLSSEPDGNENEYSLQQQNSSLNYYKYQTEEINLPRSHFSSYQTRNNSCTLSEPSNFSQGHTGSDNKLSTKSNYSVEPIRRSTVNKIPSINLNSSTPPKPYKPVLHLRMSNQNAGKQAAKRLTQRRHLPLNQNYRNPNQFSADLDTKLFHINVHHHYQTKEENESNFLSQSSNARQKRNQMK